MLPTTSLIRFVGIIACLLVAPGMREAAAQPKLKLTLESPDTLLSLERSTFTPDGKRLLTPALEEKFFWDAKTGKEVFQWKTKSWWLDSHPLFSRDGKTLYFRDRRRVESYEVATGKLLAKIELTGDVLKDKDWTGFESATVTPDDKLVIAGHHNDKVRFWDLATGKTRDLPAHPGTVYFVRISADAKLVLATYTEEKFHLLYRLSDVATGKALYSGAVPDDCWEPVGFSPDGKTVAWIASEGRKPVHLLRLSDPLTGKVKLNLKGHTEYISTAAFSPDGKYVATGSPDRTARLWDAATGRSLAVLELDGSVQGVQFSPDSKLLVTGSTSNTVKIWELNLEK